MENPQTRKVLLTGGAGFIGSHTYVALIEAGYDVAILDNFSNARRDVPDRLAKITSVPTTVYDCDIRSEQDVGKVFEADRFDAVVHFAALKSVPESEANPLAYYQNNCQGLFNVASAMKNSGVNRMVFSSSAAVYGNPATMPITEDVALSPESVYARTKRIGEEFLEGLSSADGDLRLGILRYFNPVGAHRSGMIGEDPSQPPTNLVPVIARVASGRMPSLKVFGGDFPTHDGTGIRDYIHVLDLANGHVRSLDALFADGGNHCVNLGTGTGYSVLDVVKAYERVSGRTIPYEIVDRRQGDPAISCAATERAQDVLGFRAQLGLEDMCAGNWRFVKEAV
ncbi:MAG: UDP-glucose 4-epimerase GalE [Ruegeria sp.]